MKQIAYFLLLAAITSAGVAQQPSAANYDRSGDQHSLAVFMKEGGWCWFQDPRAIIDDGKLIMGSVQGNGQGPALVGVYDLAAGNSLGRAVMHDQFKRDDHNSPVFYVRPDDRVVAMYALHGNNHKHYYRISAPGNPLEWSAEKTYQHSYPRAGTVTYMNLIPMAVEGKLYNFFRGIEFNPCFITSTDHGGTWQEATHFIADELDGRHRPYVRYVGNGTDTVHVSFTDGHPHQYGNSIYYAAFRNRNFYRADGTLIKNLSRDGPLKSSEAELVFAGSGQRAPKGRASAERSAWTSCITLDAAGRPHIAYSLHLSNEDHRYRLAAWDGKQWNDREVAYAGHCLYDNETSYTGLISLDPEDPSTVLISTNVNPSTGKDAGGKHEIYRANVAAADNVKTINWSPMSSGSPVRNLRPVIVRGDGYRVFAWLRGDFRSYSNYQLDVVGLVEKLE